MNRLALICGAGSGIGKAIALNLSGPGTNLILVGRRSEPLEQVGSECQARGSKATSFPGDITDPSACQAMVDLARDMGNVDRRVLVNSAGTASFGPFRDSETQAIEAQIRTNLLGPVYTCRAALPWMLEQGGGKIVNICSIAATAVLPGAAVYSASKAGLLAFGRGLAAEYRRQGIKVTSVILGATNTELWEFQSSSPPAADMLTTETAAGFICDLIRNDAAATVDEISLMPVKGIL